MDQWYILQIILDIYLCGFVIFYIVSYRKKEFELLKKQRLREETETKKINDSLSGFLKDSEKATIDMIDAFKKEHLAIKQSINYINLQMEELHKASEASKKLLTTVKENIPTEEIRLRQKKLQYADASNLLSKGFAPAIVAEKLKIPIGEMELINKLHTSKGTQLNQTFSA